MSKELKCPNCGRVFKVDEAEYASILNQVKNAAFKEEVDSRMAELKKQDEAERRELVLKTEKEYDGKLAAQKEVTANKDKEIAALKEKLKSMEALQKQAMETELRKKDVEITRLNAMVKQADNDKKLAVLAEQNKSQKAIHEKENELTKLRAQKEEELKFLQEQVDFYKDFKMRLSTKMLGETLEQHCSNSFNKVRTQMFPNAKFNKDNDASGGSKGDFIFRDYVDGVEYLSIMFEMKNEADTTATKHKNEDFLAKLDKDRKAKNCEYAVLVSVLEPENEFYNDGITDVSYLYPKMFVIRPQFFLNFISLLAQAARPVVEYKKEAELLKAQTVDLSHFEEKLDTAKKSFFKHYKKSQSSYEEAIKDIDKSIKALQKIKSDLLNAENYMGRANDELEGLTIRKLTYKNPTIKNMLAEAKKKDGETYAEEIKDDEES